MDSMHSMEVYGNADRMGLGWRVSLPPHPLEPESLRLGGEGVGGEWEVGAQ